MLKIFLVEDDASVRKDLCDTVPWEQCGYTFTGCATDGEMALPEIRRLNPDVLITDIRMPFMDGLALSRQVRREMPRIKIIIISGAGSFDYACQAIEIGVEQYLLKPVAKETLIKTLSEVKNKIDAEQMRQKDYMQLHQEAQEYKQFSYRRFFEKLVSGCLSVQEIYEEADKLGIDINAQSYNIVLYSFQSDEGISDRIEKVQDELSRFFLLCQELLLFRWSFSTYAVLVRSNTGMIEGSTRFCVENICRRCQNNCGTTGWYISVGTPVERLSSLHVCFSGAGRRLSYRYLCPGQHILTDEVVAHLLPENEEQKLRNVDISQISPEEIQRFLKTGLKSEVNEFVTSYLNGFGTDALNSMLFCQYTVLNFRFAVKSYGKDLGIPQDALSKILETLPPLHQLYGRQAVEDYICALLEQSIGLREKLSGSRYSLLIGQAVDYITQHYTDEDISLNEVAKAVNVSASYFSAVFSEKMGKTFTEYLTEKRMGLAKELLRETGKRFSDIAFEIGYKDSHYFSFLFKKTQGCTPREYRAGE